MRRSSSAVRHVSVSAAGLAIGHTEPLRRVRQSDGGHVSPELHTTYRDGTSADTYTGSPFYPRMRYGY